MSVEVTRQPASLTSLNEVRVGVKLRGAATFGGQFVSALIGAVVFERSF
jgi:hypothetical protein